MFDFINCHFGEILTAIGAILSAIGYAIHSAIKLIANQLVRLNSKVESIDHQFAEMRGEIKHEIPELKRRVDNLERSVYESSLKHGDE